MRSERWSEKPKDVGSLPTCPTKLFAGNKKRPSPVTTASGLAEEASQEGDYITQPLDQLLCAIAHIFSLGTYHHTTLRYPLQKQK